MINAVMPLRHDLVSNCSRRSKTGQSTGTDGAQSLGEAMHEEHARWGAGGLAMRARQVLDPCSPHFPMGWGKGARRQALVEEGEGPNLQSFSCSLPDSRGQLGTHPSTALRPSLAPTDGTGQVLTSWGPTPPPHWTWHGEGKPGVWPEHWGAQPSSKVSLASPPSEGSLGFPAGVLLRAGLTPELSNTGDHT